MRKQFKPPAADHPNGPPMPDPLAFFLTWSTYGSWLSGDERGWVEQGKGLQLADLPRMIIAKTAMKESVCVLCPEQRKVVERTIADHCTIRGWDLLAVNCRSNHVHVVVAANREPEVVRDQFKARCTRMLKQSQNERNEAVRKKWWTEGGSQRYLNDEKSLEAAVLYVRDGQ